MTIVTWGLAREQGLLCAFTAGEINAGIAHIGDRRADRPKAVMSHSIPPPSPPQRLAIAGHSWDWKERGERGVMRAQKLDLGSRIKAKAS